MMLRAAIVLVALASALAGCGIKDDPLPVVTDSAAG
jgi:predicted small lipoprotein YifL